MTVTICPDCGLDDIDETDLCGMCSELFASFCDCIRREQCEECAADEYERSVPPAFNERSEGAA